MLSYTHTYWDPHLSLLNSVDRCGYFHFLVEMAKVPSHLLPNVLGKGNQKELNTIIMRWRKVPNSKMKEQSVSGTLNSGVRESNNKLWVKRWAENIKFNKELWWRGRWNVIGSKSPGEEITTMWRSFSSLLQCQEMSFQEYDEYKETKTDLSVIYPRLSVGAQQLSSFSTKSNCNTTLECEYKTVRKIGI